MPHPESEHGLRVQLATALRERDTEKATRWEMEKERGEVNKALEAEMLRAMNAEAECEHLAALRAKQDAELVALRAEVRAWKEGVCQDCAEKDAALAAARLEIESLKTALAAAQESR